MNCKICLKKIDVYEEIWKRKKSLSRHVNYFVICDDCVKKRIKEKLNFYSELQVPTGI